MSRPRFGSLIVIGLVVASSASCARDTRLTTTPASTTADMATTDTISPLIITGLDTVALDGTTVASFSQQDVADRMMIVADYSGALPTTDAKGASFQIPS